MGASPRASLSLSRAAKAVAYLAGRDFVVPDDIKTLADPVLAHRLTPRELAADPAADLDHVLGVLIEILERTRVPL